jgi:DNA-binding NtrC family response regulator
LPRPAEFQQEGQHRVRDQLDRLVDEMLRKGILYDDARQAIERRFISRALSRSEGNLGQAADLLGIHRNTLTRKIATYRLKRTG